jgi:hypothetical protein
MMTGERKQEMKGGGLPTLYAASEVSVSVSVVCRYLRWTDGAEHFSTNGGNGRTAPRLQKADILHLSFVIELTSPRTTKVGSGIARKER